MDILKNLDLSQVLGGGYWWQDSAGYWHYSLMQLCQIIGVSSLKVKRELLQNHLRRIAK